MRGWYRPGRVGIVLVLAAFALGAGLLRPGAVRAQPVVPPSGLAQLIFLRDCATCHGADVRGTSRGPSLEGLGRAAVDYWVSTGRMPLVPIGRDSKSPYNTTPPGQTLGDPNLQPQRHRPAYPPEVIAALDDYVAALAGGSGDMPTVDLTHANLAVGGELFRLQCAACHAWAGDGGALYGREAPSLHHATPTQIAEAVRIGPGQMPAFGASAVPDQQLSDLVAYVRYLDDPNDRGGNPLWHLGPVAEGGVALVIGMGLLLIASRWIGERS